MAYLYSAVGALCKSDSTHESHEDPHTFTKSLVSPIFKYFLHGYYGGIFPNQARSNGLSRSGLVLNCFAKQANQSKQVKPKGFVSALLFKVLKKPFIWLFFWC